MSILQTLEKILTEGPKAPNALRQGLEHLGAELAKLRDETEVELAKLRDETEVEIAKLKAELTGKPADLQPAAAAPAAAAPAADAGSASAAQ